MMHWAFEGEYIACIIILILALYSRERVSHVEQQNALFYECPVRLVLLDCHQYRRHLADGAAPGWRRTGFYIC